MNLLITGGTGFIGVALCQYLQEQGHTLCVLTRDNKRARQRIPNQQIRLISDLSQISPDELIEGVINLAGAPTAERWSQSYKAELVSSRIHLTNDLIATFERLKHPPKVLISGSAIGYYGPHGDEILNEAGQFSASFSHDLCAAWEAAASKANPLGIRVCYLRTGIVLGKGGGALARMHLPFLLGLGGKMGKGKQWMSWVHRQDIIRIIAFCLENSSMEGPLNATAPEPVTNETFTKAYGKILHRPTCLSMPAVILKSALGQMAEEFLLTGQRVMPEKLLQMGFHFLYPTIDQALHEIYR